MNKTMVYHLLFTIYQIVRAARYATLITVFGAVSHCQQQPSCGTFFFQHLKKHGIISAIRHTTPRVLTCGIVPNSSIKHKANSITT